MATRDQRSLVILSSHNLRGESPVSIAAASVPSGVMKLTSTGPAPKHSPGSQPWIRLARKTDLSSRAPRRSRHGRSWQWSRTSTTSYRGEAQHV